MMKFKFSPTFILPLTALAAMLLGTAGCQDDFLSRELPEPSAPPVVVESDPSEGIAVTIPYVADFQVTPTASTRAALGVDDESAIDHRRSRLFLFTKEGTLHHEAPITKVTRDDQDKQKGTITALMKPGKELTAVLVTNLNETAMTQKVAEGTKKDALQALFTFASQQDWTADPASNHLPMWGEVGGVVIDHDAAAVPRVGTIHLLRAVARIDVGLMMSTSKQYDKDGDFDETSGELTGEYPALLPDGTKKQVTWALKKVYLYNTSASGLVIPASGNVQSETNGTKKATGVSLPADVAKIDAKGYDFTGDIVSNLLKRSIYVPETDNDPAAAGDKVPGEEYKTRPYLIVGLAYTPKEGDNKQESDITYFRIDFLKHDPAASKPDASTELEQDANVKYDYLPLLRNHRYKVDIRGVGGPGFPTIEEAKEGPAANIMYDVQVWDESELDEVVYDGQYMLGVSAKQVETYKSGGDMTLTVQTSWPKGFHVEGLPEGYTVKAAGSDKSTPDYPTTDETKLVIAPPTGEWKPTPEEQKVLDTEGYYDYTITIRAGRMTWPVTIRRYNKEELRIELFSDPECTQPLQFLSIHELGDAMLPCAHGEGKSIKEAITTPTLLTDECLSNTKYFGANDSLVARFYANPAAIPAKMPADGWFDMKKANDDSSAKNKELAGANATGNEPFTALSSGAVRKFYAKVIGPDGTTIDVRPANGTMPENSHFTIVKRGNDMTALEFVATAAECVDPLDYFEHFSEEWIFVAKTKDGTQESEPARLRLDQEEVDAAIFTDQTLANPLFAGDEPIIIMDGGERNYIIRSNGDWRAKMVSQISGGISAKHPAGKELTLNDRPILKINTADASAVITGETMISGTPFNMKIRDDINTPDKIYLAFGDLRLAVDEPLHYYKSRTRRINLVSGKLLPESQVANSYLMETNGMPMLIPFEQWVNDAAQEYNGRVSQPARWTEYTTTPWNDFLAKHRLLSIDEDDHVTCELLWTDAYFEKSVSNPKVIGTSQSAMKYIHVFSYNSKRYLFVVPGDLPGNTVIALRSSTHEPVMPYTDTESDKPYYNGPTGNNHAILWSFHFIVYPQGERTTGNILTHTFARLSKYEEMPTNGKDPSNNALYTFYSEEHTLRFLNHNLGALQLAPNNDNPVKATNKDPNSTTIVKGNRVYGTLAWENSDYTAQGMGYQWGRKDPCPLYAQHSITSTTNRFFNGKGVSVDFFLTGSNEVVNKGTSTSEGQETRNRTALLCRMSVRESIERPMYFTAENRVWMYEGGPATGTLSRVNTTWQVYGIWGGSSATGGDAVRNTLVSETKKTHFDPSPYGFSVPHSGYQSTYHLKGAASSIASVYNTGFMLFNSYFPLHDDFLPCQKTANEKKSGGDEYILVASNPYPVQMYPVMKFGHASTVIPDLIEQVNTGKGSLLPLRPTLDRSTLTDWKQAQGIVVTEESPFNTTQLYGGADARFPDYGLFATGDKALYY